jgi:hypothetical protein
VDTAAEQVGSISSWTADNKTAYVTVWAANSRTFYFLLFNTGKFELTSSTLFGGSYMYTITEKAKEA